MRCLIPIENCIVKMLNKEKNVKILKYININEHDKGTHVAWVLQRKCYGNIYSFRGGKGSEIFLNSIVFMQHQLIQYH